MSYSNNEIVKRGYGGCFYLELSRKRRGCEFSSCEEIASNVGIDIDSLKNIILNNNGEVNVEESHYGFNNRYDETIETIMFKNEEDIDNVINILKSEIKITDLHNKIKELERKYNAKDKKAREDVIELCKDEYILSIWNIEKYSEENEEGFASFEGFLLNYIEENLIYL